MGAEGGEWGEVRRGFALGGKVRWMTVDLGGPTAEVVGRHGLSGQAALWATEASVASALLAVHIKGEERLAVHVHGGSFSSSTEIRADGALRGNFRPEHLEGATLEGTLTAVKWDGTRELYRGNAQLEASFEASLQHYLTQSQQSHGRVRLSGPRGLLVEMIADAMEPDDFEAWAQGALSGPLDELLAQLASDRLEGDPVQIMEEYPLFFRCECSLGRVEGMLAALGAVELRAIEAELGGAEVTCHFCNTRYQVPGARLLEIAHSLDEGGH